MIFRMVYKSGEIFLPFCHTDRSGAEKLELKFHICESFYLCGPLHVDGPIYLLASVWTFYTYVGTSTTIWGPFTFVSPLPPEALETVRGRGQANAGGARGWSTVWGLAGGGQNSKHSKNTIMTLLLLRYVTDTNAHTNDRNAHTPLSTLISSLSLNHHLYADDTQLFFSFYPSVFDSSNAHLQDSLQKISSWMTANHSTLLKLNFFLSDSHNNLP